MIDRDVAHSSDEEIAPSSVNLVNQTDAHAMEIELDTSNHARDNALVDLGNESHLVDSPLVSFADEYPMEGFL
jgi:hypothetical protein